MNDIDVDDLIDEHENRGDYRRANGAPMVSDPANPDKWLRYSRPSGYAKVLDNSFALNDWKINKAMLGVAGSRAMQAQLLSLKDGDKDGMKVLREQALDKGQANEAADMGNALHAMTARIEDPDDLFEPPEAYVEDLKAYTDGLTTYGLKSEYIEVHMCNDSFRAAGTADRLYRTSRPLLAPDGTWVPEGALVLGDLKTGAKLDFSLPGYCVQMAIYADGVLYDVENNVRLPTPDIYPYWTILVHLPVGKARCRMIWCSIDVGLRGAQLAHDVKEWDKAWKSGQMLGYDEHEIAEPQPDTESLNDSVPDGMTDEEMAFDLLAWGRQRITEIGKNENARQALMTRWPEGLPSPKKMTALDDVARLLTLLDAIEKQYSVPFTPTGEANGKRRDQIVVR